MAQQTVNVLKHFLNSWPPKMLCYNSIVDAPVKLFDNIIDGCIQVKAKQLQIDFFTEQWEMNQENIDSLSTWASESFHSNILFDLFLTASVFLHATRDIETNKSGRLNIEEAMKSNK